MSKTEGAATAAPDLSPEDIGVERAAHVALGGQRVVKEPDLQRHDALHAQIDLLDHLSFLPVEHVQVGAVVALLHVGNVQTGLEGLGGAPLARDHHVVVRLVPVVVANGRRNLSLVYAPSRRKKGATSRSLLKRIQLHITLASGSPVMLIGSSLWPHVQNGFGHVKQFILVAPCGHNCALRGLLQGQKDIISGCVNASTSDSSQNMIT